MSSSEDEAAKAIIKAAQKNDEKIRAALAKTNAAKIAKILREANGQ